MAKRQVISCPWQDEQGNVLALGTIVFEASGDALVSGTGELCAGIKGKLALDINGTVAASPAQYMWPTDQMAPSNITYTVWVYSANGQLAWGPNYGLTVPSGAGSFNLCTWVPNQIGAGSGAAAGSLTLQVNGVNNAVQNLLDLVNGANITITDNGDGSVTIASTGSSGPRVRGWHGWTFAGQAAVEPTQGYGATPGGLGSFSGNFVELSPTATTPDMLGFGTGTGAGQLSGMFDTIAGSDNDMAWTPGILGILEKQLKLSSTASIRVWIGADDGIQNHGSNFWKSDTPPYPTVAFRYSTAAGDTFWQCVVTDGTTQVTTPTTVSPDTGIHKFAIEFSNPNFLFYIDGVLVGTVAISTTTLTSSSTFNGFFTVDNVGLGNNKIVYISYLYWDTNV
jgi:hypothetical protein